MTKQLSIIESKHFILNARSRGTGAWDAALETPADLMGVPNRFEGVLQRRLDGADLDVPKPLRPGVYAEFLVDEHVMMDGPPTAVKLMSFISPRAGWSDEAFLRYWQNDHASFAATLTPIWRHVRRYVQNHVRGPSVRTDGRPFTARGVLELYFDSEEAIKTAFAQPEVAALRADEERFIDRSLSTRIFVREGR